MQDHAFILSEKCFGGCPQNLRVGKVYKADDGCAEQVNKKDHFIGAVVMNEFFECMHKKFLSSYDFYLVSHDVATRTRCPEAPLETAVLTVPGMLWIKIFRMT